MLAAPSKSSPSAARPQWLRRAIALASPILFAAAVWLGTGHFDPGLRSADTDLIALNALPFFLVAVATWLLIGRTLFALAVGASAQALFQFAHRAKLEHLSDPLVPSDLLMLPQVLGNLDFFLRYGPSPWLLLGALVLIALALRLEPRSLRWPWLVHLAVGSLPVLALAGLWNGWQPWPAVYTSPPIRFELWQPRESAQSSGAAAFFIRLAWISELSVPKPDEKRLAELLARLPQQASGQAADVQPDIVILQSESFFDPGRMNGIESADYIPNLIALSESGASGDVRVPAFGGKTTRTEFEVLTGLSLAALPRVDYPYQGLVRATTQSLARGLRDQGYATIAIHPYHPHFYRRESVYPQLGFDRFVSLKEFRQRDHYGFYVSDDALVSRILAELDAPGESPRFVFAVSMENHGPWGPTRAKALPDTPEPLPGVTLERSLAEPMEQYLHHVRRSDAALARLAQAISARERPTLLLFFGDHLPGLVPSFSAIGFRDGKPAWEQPVPFLLLDNRRSRASRMALRSDELPALLLESAGLDLGEHFRDLARLRRATDLAEEEREELRRGLSLLSLNSSVESAASNHAFRLVSIDTPRVSISADGQPAAIRLRALGVKDGSELRLENSPLSTVRFGERIEASVPSELIDSLGALPRMARLELVAPGGVSHEIGIIELVAGPNASAAEGFCAVEAWGPDETKAGKPSNPQPDGSQGLWIKIPCYPSDAIVTLGSHALETYHQPGLITAKLPLSRMDQPGSLEVFLSRRSGAAKLRVGLIQVTSGG